MASGSLASAFHPVPDHPTPVGLGSYDSPHRVDVDGANVAVAPSAAAVQQRLAYDRTFLANERTYAAWLRTGLAIAGGGIAVAHLVPEPSRDSWIALGLGSAFVLAGVSVIAHGTRQFTRTTARLAQESGRATPVPARLPAVLTGVLSLMLLAVLLFLWTHQGRVADTAVSAGAAPAHAAP